MTKEEAISIIGGYEAYGCGYCLQGGDEVEEALRLAVDALRQETVIRCKGCKHRPKRTGDDEHEGLNLEFPDEKCPCQCEDPWYNWMPKDNWYCGNGERK